MFVRNKNDFFFSNFLTNFKQIIIIIIIIIINSLF